MAHIEHALDFAARRAPVAIVALAVVAGLGARNSAITAHGRVPTMASFARPTQACASHRATLAALTALVLSAGLPAEPLGASDLVLAGIARATFRPGPAVCSAAGGAARIIRTAIARRVAQRPDA